MIKKIVLTTLCGYLLLQLLCNTTGGLTKYTLPNENEYFAYEYEIENIQTQYNTSKAEAEKWLQDIRDGWERVGIDGYEAIKEQIETNSKAITEEASDVLDAIKNNFNQMRIMFETM